MIHPSTQAMLDFEPTGTFTPVAATREMLLSMEKADVFVVQWPASALGYDFYRNMMPEVCPPCLWSNARESRRRVRRRFPHPSRSLPLPQVPVVLCHSCNHFFHEEDWDMAVMQKGCCPFCKAPVDASYGNGCALTHPPKKTAAQLKKGQSWDAVRNIAATSVQERVVEVSRATVPPACEAASECMQLARRGSGVPAVRRAELITKRSIRYLGCTSPGTRSLNHSFSRYASLPLR